MVQLEFNITIDDNGKMSIVSNVLRREDARDIEDSMAHGLESTVIAMTEAIAIGEGLGFHSEKVKPEVSDYFCPICCMQNDDESWCRCDDPKADDSKKLLRQIYALVRYESPEIIKDKIRILFRGA